MDTFTKTHQGKVLPRPKATAARPPRSRQRVITCYDVLDLANHAVDGGIEDFTDGMYFGDAAIAYAKAQRNQAEWLLDQVDCRAGSRLLDVGCGNGTLLETARGRGAHGTGITISPQQVARCRRKDLDVRLCDYRSMDASYNGRYDCAIANGSIEHFVQAADGRADAIYRRMFAIFHRVLDRSHPARLATTVIHFDRIRIDPREMSRGPLSFRWGSDAFHYSLLVHSFGGFYPVPGQLARSAAPYFRLIDEQDGTDDYHLTSEHWLGLLRKSIGRSPRFHIGILRKLFRHPVQTPRMLTCLLLAQSWNWQFRGDHPPMRLLRQVWQAE